jgi:hypothetical protein
MKIQGKGWFAMAAIGAEMAAVGRRMEKQQKLTKAPASRSQPKTTTDERVEYSYTLYEEAVVSLGNTIADLLEILVINNVKVPDEIMSEARMNLDFMEYLLNLGGINNYQFGSK